MSQNPNSQTRPDRRWLTDVRAYATPERPSLEHAHWNTTLTCPFEAGGRGRPGNGLGGVRPARSLRDLTPTGPPPEERPRPPPGRVTSSRSGTLP